MKLATLGIPKANTKSHNRLMKDMKSHVTLMTVSSDMNKKINYNMPFEVLLPGREEREWYRTDLLKADRCWYTDGLEIPEGVGTGAYIVYVEVRKTKTYTHVDTFPRPKPRSSKGSWIQPDQDRYATVKKFWHD